MVISFFSYDLLFKNNNKLASVKTKNNKISNNSLLMTKVPPIKANGIEPNKNGVNNLKL